MTVDDISQIEISTTRYRCVVEVITGNVPLLVFVCSALDVKRVRGEASYYY
jgi:hypothetical protein